MKWAIDGTPRQDQIDWLAGQMAAQVSPALHTQLFSADHSAERDYLAALTVIDDCASNPAVASEACDLPEQELRDRLVANFDLIIKYLTLRLASTSTTITVKCLDLIDHIIPVLSQAEYRASDYEALPLLVSLVNKVRLSDSSMRMCTADLRRLSAGRRQQGDHSPAGTRNLQIDLLGLPVQQGLLDDLRPRHRQQERPRSERMYRRARAAVLPTWRQDLSDLAGVAEDRIQHRQARRDDAYGCTTRYRCRVHARRS